MIQDSLPEQELAEEELAEVVAQSVVKNMDLYALIRAITFRGFSDVLKKILVEFRMELYDCFLDHWPQCLAPCVDRRPVQS